MILDANSQLLSVIKARELTKNGHMMKIDLQNAYNSVPYETIVYGLHK